MKTEEIREAFIMDPDEWRDDKASVIGVRALGEIAAQLSELKSPSRDRMAMEYLQAFIACDKSGTTFWSTGPGMEYASTNAYSWADAMIAARNKVSDRIL